MTGRLASLAVLLMSVTACDPCAGTPSCHVEPEISYTGQVIEFPSGRIMSGVQVAFARGSGVALERDTIRATSDASGFFVLRSGALGDGEAEGTLTVTPRLPHAAYGVQGVRLATHRKRGDGGFLGRIFVNPFVQFIAELRDLETDDVVPNATVIIRQRSAVRLSPESTVVQSGENGWITWDPQVIDFGELDLELEVSAAGYPRAFLLRHEELPQWRDQLPFVRVLQVGAGRYVGEVLRRGTRLATAGIAVEFVRTGGILSQPTTFTATTNANGRFDFVLTLSGAPGDTLFGDLIIGPPAPFAPETVHVAVSAFDGGPVRLLGPFGYGPGFYARPVLLYRATGLPIKTGTHARFTRVGGLSNVTPAPWGVVPDDGIRIVDSTGTVGYDAATLDTGVVLYDIEVRLNAPHEWETLRAMPVPARLSDASVIDTFRVGAWHPWIGGVRDAVTGSPVNGATIAFQRTAGALVNPASFTVTSGADGTFPLQPEPLASGAVDAVLVIRAAPLYRDTTVTVRLTSAQDDSIRSIGFIGLRRSQ